MKWLALLIAAGFLAGCSQGFGLGGVDRAPAMMATPPAPSFSDGAHIVVTIELGDEAADLAIAEALADQYDLDLIVHWPLGSINARCLVFKLAPEAVETTLTAIVAEDAVTRAQPVIEHLVSGAPGAADLAALQTNMQAMNAQAAHRYATGHGVRVAVIDTGLDADHPDLNAGLELVRDFVGLNGDAPPERHGTAVAGLIGGNGAFRGVAFDATLIALRSCWQEAEHQRGLCNTLSLARALNFAAASGVDVINLSIAGPEDPLLVDLIDIASRNGVVLVAAADAGGAAFPASHPAVIPAHPLKADIMKGEIAAPATNVLSTSPGGSYDFFSGSSVAAAQVSGVAALLREFRPDAGAAAVRESLTDAAMTRGARASAVIDACLALSKVAAGERQVDC